jgi:hypothetical protein
MYQLKQHRCHGRKQALSWVFQLCFMVLSRDTGILSLDKAVVIADMDIRSPDLDSSSAGKQG